MRDRHLKEWSLKPSLRQPAISLEASPGGPRRPCPSAGGPPPPPQTGPGGSRVRGSGSSAGETGDAALQAGALGQDGAPGFCRSRAGAHLALCPSPFFCSGIVFSSEIPKLPKTWFGLKVK